MAVIEYSIFGTRAPFGVELRENNIGGEVLRDEVKEVAGSYSFENVSDGTYVIVVYDNSGGKQVSPLIIVNTTTTTVPPTTSSPVDDEFNLS